MIGELATGNLARRKETLLWLSIAPPRGPRRQIPASENNNLDLALVGTTCNISAGAQREWRWLWTRSDSIEPAGFGVVFEFVASCGVRLESTISCACVNADASYWPTKTRTRRNRPMRPRTPRGRRPRRARSSGHREDMIPTLPFGSSLQILHVGESNFGHWPPDVHRGGGMGNLRADPFGDGAGIGGAGDRAAGSFAIAAGRPYRGSLSAKTDRAREPGAQRNLLARARVRLLATPRHSELADPTGGQSMALSIASVFERQTYFHFTIFRFR